ncbi:L-threonylcarbamoyladenylate synthase [Aeromicrobium chenweiae]|uniref:L-threonylcarbamoyladenylate synthase n=1 Tax=Aeromicrobium chenweiae TaxID=2079793 RepID=A0A2S0WNP7_9ACTN|nr:L-threonylcarbamoyladenylate synthase [Aeromicrobium chenweiae]AWB92955.1 threonylcarbamoyl-AMP synthase [Aeromicrobium chenweiae]TGN33948.1 threonylcarbamoyl-AMP synthase [Aeromicrobium chenweiae]
MKFDCSVDEEFDRGLRAAQAALEEGKLVVLPTDTVYGIAADAFSPRAVQNLLDAKGRGRDMPPPVLIGAPTTLDALATNVPAWLRSAVEALWPGPLTIICHQQASLTWDLGETHNTVAIRMPDDKRALALLKQTGPLAVSSANTTGQPAAQTIEQAQDMLGGRVAVYLDGGPTSSGVPSTILDATGATPRILRQGAVPLEALHRFNNTIEPAKDAEDTA